jgi:prephenate dehydrogenase
MSDALPSQVAVIGFGRFGQLWSSMLGEDFTVVVHDRDEDAAGKIAEAGLTSVPLRDALACEVIFYCVPISEFEPTIIAHCDEFKKMDGSRTLIDVLSVKLHAKDVFDRHLPDTYQAMLTHPMFGPDSVAAGGLRGQSIVLDSYRMQPDAFAAWKKYFEDKGLAVVRMTADEHDRLAAESQGVTHFMGRTLERFGFAPTPIDTLGTKQLREVASQVSNDTWQLFVDLQTLNPHTRDMRVRLSEAQNTIFDQLLPNRINTGRLVVGIQGGRGSFNEEAARYYMNRTPNMPYEFAYLHTTDRVLKALHDGTIDRGQFAIHNSLGGMVGESVDAMAKYRFAIVEEFAIKISHALMIASDADFSKVDTIMTHPQVLRQCHTSLEKKYPALRQTSGEGDLVDHAKVAELLGNGELPKTTATMGSKVLADINGLIVVEDNLQDLDENFTSFLWVERPRSA